jgi:hypothetical protein
LGRRKGPRKVDHLLLCPCPKIECCMRRERREGVTYECISNHVKQFTRRFARVKSGKRESHEIEQKYEDYNRRIEALKNLSAR